MSRSHHKYTLEQIAWMKVRPNLTRKQLAHAFNATWGTSISDDGIKSACYRFGIKTGRSGKFEKGQISWNIGKKGVNGTSNTTFKKGQLPHNHNPIGHVRYCKKDGYMEVKLTDTRVTRNDYKAVHRITYEHYHGPIPPSHVISFRDGNIYNFKIENLELVSRSLHAVRCKMDYYSYPQELRPQLDAIIDLRRSMSKRTKGVRNAHTKTQPPA